MATRPIRLTRNVLASFLPDHDAIRQFEKLFENVDDIGETIDDRVAALIQDGTGITWTYDDASDTLTGNTVWKRSGTTITTATALDDLRIDGSTASTSVSTGALVVGGGAGFGGGLFVGDDSTFLAPINVETDTLGGTIASFKSFTGARSMDIISPVGGSSTNPFIFSTNNAFQFKIDAADVFRIDSNKHVYFNSDQNPVNVYIYKNTSGTAYQYDSASDLHTFFTDISVEPKTLGGTVASFRGFTGARSMDIISPVGGSTTNPFIFSTGNAYQFKIDALDVFRIDSNKNIFFNSDQTDSDFTLYKNVSGSAVVYDSGLDTLTVDSVTSITDATASTSTSTGALVVTGGLGVGGALNVGGAFGIDNQLTINHGSDGFANSGLIINAQGASGEFAQFNNFNGNEVFQFGTNASNEPYMRVQKNSGAGVFQLGSTLIQYLVPVANFDSTQSTSTTTGSHTFSGGVGIAKNLYVGESAVLNASAGVNDVSILKATSGTAYIYDNSLDRHGWGTGTPLYDYHFQRSGVTQMTIESTSNSASKLNLLNSVGNFDLKVKGGSNGFAIVNEWVANDRDIFRIANSADKLAQNISSTTVEFNPSSLDLDFTIKGQTSDAYIYDAGSHNHTYTGVVGIGTIYTGAFLNVEDTSDGTGGGGFIRSLRLVPTLTGTASDFATQITLPKLDGAFTQTNTKGLTIFDVSLANGALATNYAGILIRPVSSATNSSHLVLGQNGIPSGNWAIYSASTYDSQFDGAVSITDTTESTSTTTGALVISGGVGIAKQLSVGQSIRTSAVETVTASSDTLDDTNHVVLCDCTSNAITINLPTAVGNTGLTYKVKKIDSTANAVTVDGATTETIDGSTTAVLSSQYDAIQIVSNGTNWFIV